MRASLVAVSFGSLLFSTACFGFGFARGSGNVVHESREVPAFHAVHISHGIHAELAVGPQRAIELSGDDNILRLLETEVEDGELRIGFPQNQSISTDHAIQVRIVAPRLDAIGSSGGSTVRGEVARGDLSIEASGGSDVKLTGIDADLVEARGSGGTTFAFAGRTSRLALQLSGGGEVHAAKLTAARVQLQGSGGSQGEVYASESVKGHLSGGSSMRVLGKARTRVDTSGGSSIDYGDAD